MDTGMDVTHVGEAVQYALSQPPGVAIDLLEIRPNTLTSKAILQ
jgi:NADP-dependent 3-hydroxy acid dehydrogenase YdfG